MLYKDKILNYLIYFLGLFSSVGCLLFSFPFYENTYILYSLVLLILVIHSFLYIKNKKLFYIFTIFILIISLTFFIFGITYYIDVVLTKYMQVSKYTFHLFNNYNYKDNLIINIFTIIPILLLINLVNLNLFEKKKYILSIFVLFSLVFIEILFTITPPLLCIGGYILYCVLIILQKKEIKFRFLPILVSLSMMLSILYVIPPDTYKHPRSKKGNVTVSYGIPSEGSYSYNIKYQGNRYYLNRVDLIVNGITDYSFKLRGRVYNVYSGNTWFQDTANMSRNYQLLDRNTYMASILNCLVTDIEIVNKFNSKLQYVPYEILSLPDNIKYYESHFEGENTAEYFMYIPNQDLKNYLSLTINEKNNFSSHYDISLPKLTQYTFNMQDDYIPEETQSILINFLLDNEIYDYYFNYLDLLSQDQINMIESKNITFNHEPLEYIEKLKEAIFKNTEYSLEPGITPDNEDFFDYFLNKNKKGYCVHYASTLALILKLSGIEANFVTGYQVNGNSSKNDFTEVLDSDAHAWVEIYDPILGIIPIEATPSRSSTNINQDNPSNNPISPNPPSNNDDTTITQRPNDIEIEKDRVISPYVYIVLAIVLLFIIVYLQSRLRYKYRFHKLNPNQSVCLMYYHLLKLECDIEDDIHRLGKKAKFSQHMITNHDVDTMLNLYHSTLLHYYKNCNLLNKCVIKIIYAYI